MASSSTTGLSIVAHFVPNTTSLSISRPYPYRRTLEAKARKHRYQAFSKIVQPHQGPMLAHHAHDQAETIAQRLCMGSGLAGLRGMPQARMHADFKSFALGSRDLRTS